LDGILFYRYFFPFKTSVEISLIVITLLLNFYSIMFFQRRWIDCQQGIPIPFIVLSVAIVFRCTFQFVHCKLSWTYIPNIYWVILNIIWANLCKVLRWTHVFLEFFLFFYLHYYLLRFFVMLVLIIYHFVDLLNFKIISIYVGS